MDGGLKHLLVIMCLLASCLIWEHEVADERFGTPVSTNALFLHLKMEKHPFFRRAVVFQNKEKKTWTLPL